MRSFADRAEAGRQLGKALSAYKVENPLTVGLLRGGVLVAHPVWEELGWDLDVMPLKKLRAPENPELAIGAIGEGEAVYLNMPLIQQLGVKEEYIDDEVAGRYGDLFEEIQLYRHGVPRISPKNRLVILVDDGLATGATMIASIQVASAQNPASIVVAVPTGSPDTVEKIRNMKEVSEVVCLWMPEDFGAVGQCYKDFKQVTDKEVLALLHQVRHSNLSSLQ
ncbi:MAG: phosphoribosyltransferase [Deltaproteobacteria bacterium]|nr:phosphoribosyltransferase [Deltaproteobacteria bacterium]